MGKALVIVESPAKAKTINKFLGKDYVVKASMGHLRDLPKTKLGVDEDKDFKPTYVVVPDKKKKAIVTELKKAAAKANAIYLAPDPDREGEAISFHLKALLEDDAGGPFHRVTFNEITRKAVLGAFEHTTKIDSNMVDAQQTRRILDRLVGYKISPLLWDKVRRGLSAGRVQSVALRMITEREREIGAFQAVEYWSLTALLDADSPPPFRAKLTKVAGKKTNLGDEKATNDVLSGLKKASAWTVTSVQAKERRRQPAPPFITSQMQQAAARRHGFGVKKTMTLAQHLYEGKDIGERGGIGLITYMRTDSTRVSADALEMVREYIAATYGKDHMPEGPRYYRARKDAQEAHEAIRPTDMSLTPEVVRPYLQADEYKLYALIWQRFVASQMEAALFDTTTADIEAANCTFRATGSVLKFAGWLAAYGGTAAVEDSARNEKTDEKSEAGSDGASGNGGGSGEAEGDGDGGADGGADAGVEEGLLPPLVAGQVLKLRALEPKQHFTQPPPRYTEATLVKALEENGIGRPSTYAAIIGVLGSREYTTKEQKAFKPTELGMLVSDLLVENFGDLINVDYTARLEEELDEIEEGRKHWVDALTEFNTKFKKDLAKAKKSMRDVKRQEIPTDEACAKCGKPMIIRWGRFGQFKACSGYPECKNTQELNEGAGGAAGSAGAGAAGGGAGGAAETIEIEEACEKCGKPLIVKRGRFGRFLACSGYPDCKNTRRLQVDKEGNVTSTPDRLLDIPCPQCAKPLAVKNGRFGEYTACSGYPTCRYIKLEEIGVGCPRPECEGQVVARRSRRGKTFYGCDRYPKCDFVAWNKPISEACPDCKSPYLLEKTTKREGTKKICPNENCSFAVKAS